MSGITVAKQKGRKLRIWFWGVVSLIFIIKLFDSLYVRQHGDALGYHLYWPYNWVNQGYLWASLWQALQWQGTLYETLIGWIFMIYRPESLGARENTVIAFQVVSLTVGYIGIPSLLWTYGRERLSPAGIWVALSAFYGSEYLLFTTPFAKNDSIAMFFFLWAALTPSTALRSMLFAITAAVKGTYVFGIALYIATFSWGVWRRGWIGRPEWVKSVFWMVAATSFGVGTFWLRNYFATGNPMFPLPSSMGMQGSEWLRLYFDDYAGKSNFNEAFSKIIDLSRKNPIIPLMFFGGGIIALVRRFKEKDLALKNIRQGWDDEQVRDLFFVGQGFFLWSPLVYVFVTGRQLEWRTFAGVVILGLWIAVEELERVWDLDRKKWSAALLIIIGFSTSKIDLSSFNRWRDSRGKSYAELVVHGDTYRRLNEILQPTDIVLTQHFTEGFFLNAQLYQASHHPLREVWLEQFPQLQNDRNFIVIKTEGPCHNRGWNEPFANALAAKNASDILTDPHPHVFHLTLKCENSGT